MTRVIRNAYQTVRSITTILGESKVQATKGNDTDVNRIMERFTRTGVLPQPTKEAQYADVSEYGDLQTILTRGKEAEQRLGELQAEEKRRQQQNQQQINDETTPPAETPDPPAEPSPT